jgi:hypothetical protein
MFKSRLGFVCENSVTWAIGGYSGVSGCISGDDRQNQEISFLVVE